MLCFYCKSVTLDGNRPSQSKTRGCSLKAVWWGLIWINKYCIKFIIVVLCAVHAPPANQSAIFHVCLGYAYRGLYFLNFIFFCTERRNNRTSPTPKRINLFILTLCLFLMPAIIWSFDFCFFEWLMCFLKLNLRIMWSAMIPDVSSSAEELVALLCFFDLVTGQRSGTASSSSLTHFFSEYF